VSIALVALLALWSCLSTTILIRALIAAGR
jgi:hypothetical protein